MRIIRSRTVELLELDYTCGVLPQVWCGKTERHDPPDGKLLLNVIRENRMDTEMEVARYSNS